MSPEPELPHMLPKWSECLAVWDEVDGNVIEMVRLDADKRGRRESEVLAHES